MLKRSGKTLGDPPEPRMTLVVILAKAPEKDDPSEFVAELWSETFEIPKGRRPVLALAVPTRLATDQALPLILAAFQQAVEKTCSSTGLRSPCAQYLDQQSEERIRLMSRHLGLIDVGDIVPEPVVYNASSVNCFRKERHFPDLLAFCMSEALIPMLREYTKLQSGNPDASAITTLSESICESLHPDAPFLDQARAKAILPALLHDSEGFIPALRQVAELLELQPGELAARARDLVKALLHPRAAIAMDVIDLTDDPSSDIVDSDVEIMETVQKTPPVIIHDVDACRLFESVMKPLESSIDAEMKVILGVIGRVLPSSGNGFHRRTLVLYDELRSAVLKQHDTELSRRLLTSILPEKPLADTAVLLGALATLRPDIMINDEAISGPTSPLRLLLEAQILPSPALFVGLVDTLLMQANGNWFGNGKGLLRRVEERAASEGKEVYSVMAKARFLYPLNVGNIHWTSAMADIEAKAVEYYDSMLSSEPTRSDPTMDRLMRKHVRPHLEWLHELGFPIGDLDEWTFVNKSSQRTNQGPTLDCGLFSVLIMMLSAGGVDLSQEQHSVSASIMGEKLRRKIAYTMCFPTEVGACFLPQS